MLTTELCAAAQVNWNPTCLGRAWCLRKTKAQSAASLQLVHKQCLSSFGDDEATAGKKKHLPKKVQLIELMKR
jgi:hypothetical protein